MFKNRHTMRKRIARGIRTATIISIFFFSLIIIGIMGFAAKATGLFLCYFMSTNISKEISSSSFLQMLHINYIREINSSLTYMDEWKADLNHRLKLSTLLDSRLPKDIKLDNVEDFYFMHISITINGNEIFENRNQNQMLYEKKIQQLKERHLSQLTFIERQKLWLDSYFDIKVSSPINDTSGIEVGQVVAVINKDLLLISSVGSILLVLTIALFANIIAGVFSNIFSRPIIMPLNRLVEMMEDIATGKLEESLNNPIVMKKPLLEIEALINSTNTIISRIKGYTKLLESQNSELEVMALDQLEINDAIGRKNNQLQNILDNVGQGFLTFGNDLIIDEECSLQCHKIFGKCVSGKILSDMLYQEDLEQKKFMDTVFNKIFIEEDKDKLDLYITLLPEEVTVGIKNISIEYKVVNNIDSEHNKCIMVILTDITEKRLLERKMEEERNTSKMVVKTVVHLNDFINCVQDYESFVLEDLPLLKESKKSLREIIYEIYRNIHNFKGNFSQYDTFNFVNKLHELENWINDIKNKEGLTTDEFSSYLNSFNMLQWLYDDLGILKSILGENFLNKKDSILINKNTLIEIEEKMVKLLPSKECRLLLPDLRRLRYKPFKELLYGFPDYIEKLSERLDKVINPLTIEGEDILVDLDYYRDFTKSLVHVFRNCLDHGIESLEERVMMGKQELGTIRCLVEKVDNSIRLTISDDGKGIDLEAIRKKAVQLELSKREDASLLTQEELLNLIFKEDFSTKEEVSEISGRGIGLSSVLKELLKLNGKVDVNTEPGIGTKFIFSIPIHQIDYIPQISIRNMVGTLVKTASAFINNTSEIGLDNCFKMESSDRFRLNTISAFINITGAIHGIIIISFNENLANKLVKDFLIDDIESDQIDEYLEDVVAECSNIILGNSIRHFGEIEELISIGIPTIVCYKGASIKYSNSNMLCCNLIKDDYEVSFSFICID